MPFKSYCEGGLSSKPGQDVIQINTPKIQCASLLGGRQVRVVPAANMSFGVASHTNAEIVSVMFSNHSNKINCMCEVTFSFVLHPLCGSMAAGI